MHDRSTVVFYENLNVHVSVRVTTNKETGQMLLSGMGELHLEILQDRILNHYKADAQFGPIYIAYRYSNA